MINPNLKLATMFIIVALGTIGTTATAFAETQLETSEEDQARIEIADRAVHETFEPEEGEQVSDTDLAFHQGLCQVGITTEALEELGGCDALPPLVEIDE